MPNENGQQKLTIIIEIYDNLIDIEKAKTIVKTEASNDNQKIAGDIE